MTREKNGKDITCSLPIFFSISISRHFHFTFYFPKRLNKIFISLFTSRKDLPIHLLSDIVILYFFNFWVLGAELILPKYVCPASFLCFVGNPSALLNSKRLTHQLILRYCHLYFFNFWVHIFLSSYFGSQICLPS